MSSLAEGDQKYGVFVTANKDDAPPAAAGICGCQASDAPLKGQALVEKARGMVASAALNGPA